MARTTIAAAAIDQRRYCHHHHCVIVVNGGGKDTITTTTINCFCRTTTIGSVSELPSTTTTATLTLIALVLAFPWRRIKRWEGELAAMHLFHCCRGHRCWCRLHLRSQDNGTKEDGGGDRRGRHADIRGQEEVGHHNPICPCACRQLSRALLYADAALHVAIAAGPLHALHAVLNLIVASFALVLDNRYKRREDGDGGVGNRKHNT